MFGFEGSRILFLELHFILSHRFKIQYTIYITSHSWICGIHNSHIIGNTVGTRFILCGDSRDEEHMYDTQTVSTPFNFELILC